MFLRTLLLAAVIFSSIAEARDIPALSAPVVDEAGLLTGREEAFLSDALERFRKERGPQIQVLTIPSLDGEPLESFSIRVVDAWKLGEKGKDNGILFLVVHNDRKMRIEVGRGLEGDIPDALAGRILDGGVRPLFRRGQFRDGINKGAQLIAIALGGELNGMRDSPRVRVGNSEMPLGFTGLLLLLFFAFFPGFSILSFILFAILGKRIPIGALPNMSSRHSSWGYSSRSSSSSWGGGFGGGGGGGGFSGGGASSGW